MKTLIPLALIFGGFVALQWHDNDTKENIAAMDCGRPVVMVRQ